ncbi:MAG: hypothetical protein IJ068_01835 [Bacilli bacterium]|nr:hypothetical protein [Bacilli bacterium]
MATETVREMKSEDGQEIFRIFENEEGNSTKIEHLDSNGNLLKTNIYDDNGNNLLRTNIYDENGNIVETNHFSREQGHLYKETTYEDNKYVVTKYLTEEVDDKNKNVFEYPTSSDKGVERVYRDGVIIETYVIDENGNRINSDAENVNDVDAISGAVTKQKQYKYNDYEEFKKALQGCSTTDEVASLANESNPELIDKFLEEVPNYLYKDSLSPSNIGESQSEINGLVPLNVPLSEIYPLGSYYDKDEKDKLVRYINSLQDNTSSIRHAVNQCSNIYDNLLDETKKHISNIDSYIESMISIVNSYDSRISGIASHVEWIAKKAETESKDVGTAANPGKVGSTHRSSGSSNSDDNTESADPTPVTETPVETPVPTENTGLVSAAVGAVTFAEIVPMYINLGSEATENSATTTTYGLLGIENYNGNYYYKVIDKTTGKIYYVEKTKANYEGDANEVLEVKNQTIRYDTTNLDNEDNNAKVIGDGRYLVLGTETVTEEDRTFNFAKVLDSTDGKAYYIQVNDNVGVTALDALGNESGE